MPLSLDHGALLFVWSFLGAHYITTDIHLALQTHAVERQFNNWIFHVLMHVQARQIFEFVHFHSFPAHPRLTRRLQGALDLVALRCVNQDFYLRSTAVLQIRNVDLHELVLASRPVRSLRHYISNVPQWFSAVHPFSDIGYDFNDIHIVFREVRKTVEDLQQHRDGSLRLLEIMLEKLCAKKTTVGLKVFHYEPTPVPLEVTAESTSQ